MDTTNPFPGLRPFREKEEHLFFGRERQVDVMVDKLAATRFLAVVGTSGSGKSSLVNCGLRPWLHRGLMDKAGSTWRMAQFRPGSNPIAAMAHALAANGVLFTYKEEEKEAQEQTRRGVVETYLRISKRGLLDIYRKARLPRHANLLVVVDQFEELFRYQKLTSSDTEDTYGMSAEATAFVNLLLEVQTQTDLPIYVVLTMRSDFLGDCVQFQGLPEAINAGQFLVPRMTRGERRAAIAGPVDVGGAVVEPILLTQLVNDVGDNPDQLSILQHALNRTWAQWEEEGEIGPLALSHYQTIGKISKALDQHAEAALADLNVEQQKHCEKLFKALTDKGTDTRGIRRPTTLDQLCALAGATPEEITQVIDVFREPSRSFLMPSAGEPLDAGTVVDISHESLMRVWKRLEAWAAEEAQSAQTYRRLTETSVLHAAGKANLWQDPELQLALDWREKEQPTAAWAALYGGGFEHTKRFLEESKKEKERKDQEDADQLKHERKKEQELAAANRRGEEKAKSIRRLRRLIMGGVATILIIAFFASLAWMQRNKAQELAEKIYKKQDSLLVANYELSVALQENATTASPDGKYIATTSLEGKTRVWNTENGVNSTLPLTISGKVTALDFRPDGALRLVTGSKEGKVSLWELDPFGLDTTLFELSASIHKVRFSPDGRRMAIASGNNVLLCSWAQETLQFVLDTTYQNANPAIDFHFSPDGESILAIDAESEITALGGDLVVVVSGDRTEDSAREEMQRALQADYPATLYRKEGMFRTTLGPFLAQRQAESSRNAIANMWPDAYVVNLKSWCPQREQADDYIECSVEIDERQPVIVDLFSSDVSTRRSALARILACCTSNEEIVIEAITYLQENLDNINGTINTLHFLRAADLDLLRENEDQLRALFQALEDRKPGPDTADYIRDIRRRLR